MAMAFKVVIPARYGSTRLPGKPLLELAGKPLVQHVYERARASAAAEVVVATDDERIAVAARGFGAHVCMTGGHHKSGSDRIAEVLEKLAWSEDTCVVNLQGDEPCMPSALVNQVAEDLEEHPGAVMSTLAAPITEKGLLFDPHVVKVVTDAEGFALYFSRAPIPWHRDEFLRGDAPLPAATEFRRHIGLYAYRAGFLRRYVNWTPAGIENAESLEQLRVLWHGERIHVSRAVTEPRAGVDTRDDLVRVEKLIRGGGCT
jgi:3-deoxy-manno-octulosonate cytidylyltransferase (CMP-KDO synthetase)